MTDYKLANLIIQRYNEQNNRGISLFTILKKNSWLNLAHIFNWDKSPEGGNFWYITYKKFIRNDINLYNFLSKNLKSLRKMDNSELANLIVQRFIEQRPNVDWKNFLLRQKHYISDAFVWDRTPEGGEFWSTINNKVRMPLRDFLRIHLYSGNFIDLEFYIR